jgi:ADP-ribose pyrophosphatase YjhB (NUDIX family)
MSSKKFIEFEHIFPFSIVEIIICDENNNFLLTKRAIKSFKNKWHFPGGLVEKNISLKKWSKSLLKEK